MRYNFSPIIFFYLFICSCNHPVANEKKSEAINDPPSSCSFSKNGQSTEGKAIRVVEEQKFLAMPFPDNEMKEYYHDNDYLKGYASCARVDSIMGIYFNFKIHSDEAFQVYGEVKKDNKIRFVLASGKSIDLSFGKTFSGNTNLSKEMTEYSSFARLTKEDAQTLKSEALQSVRISWGKKDEDYTDVNPSVFVNQIPCIE